MVIATTKTVRTGRGLELRRRENDALIGWATVRPATATERERAHLSDNAICAEVHNENGMIVARSIGDRARERYVASAALSALLVVLFGPS